MKKILLSAAAIMILLITREGFCREEVVDPGGGGGGGAHTYIKVIDKLTRQPVHDAAVILFDPMAGGDYRYVVLRGYTGNDGLVEIDEALYNTRHSYFHIVVERFGYYEAFDGHPFSFGETFEIEIKPYCGDFVCQIHLKEPELCPQDCGRLPVCPNQRCEGPLENAENCPQDCGLRRPIAIQPAPEPGPEPQIEKPAAKRSSLKAKKVE